MKLTPLYDVAKPPMPGYEGLEVKVLLNPTGETWEDFAAGGFAASDQDQALIGTLKELIAAPDTTDKDRATYTKRLADFETELAERQTRMGRALHTLYGATTPIEIDADAGIVLDFSSPEAALKTAQDKRLPDEIAFWLTVLPTEVVTHRRKLIREQLPKSFGSKS